MVELVIGYCWSVHVAQVFFFLNKLTTHGNSFSSSAYIITSLRLSYGSPGFPRSVLSWPISLQSSLKN